MVVSLGILAIGFPDAAAAAAIVAILSGIVLVLIHKFTDDGEYLARIFLIALLVRLAFGIFIHVFDLRGVFWRGCYYLRPSRKPTDGDLVGHFIYG